VKDVERVRVSVGLQRDQTAGCCRRALCLIEEKELLITDRGVAGDESGGQHAIKIRLQQGSELHCDKGVTAGKDEVIVEGKVMVAKSLRPGGADTRREVVVGDELRLTAGRARQGGAVKLPVGVERKVIQADEGAGHHGLRQPRTKKLGQLPRAGPRRFCGIGRNPIRDRARMVRRALPPCSGHGICG